jgi:hypothetical protein
VKLKDKLLYFGSAALPALALAVYLTVQPLAASVQGGSCTGCEAEGKCFAFGACAKNGCFDGGQICGVDQQWGSCGGC